MKAAFRMAGILGMLGAVSTVAAAGEIPKLRTENGRHALVVDGKPYLILGAQAHNSSNYPSVLPQIWPVISVLNANTLEIPVAWEQFEPTEGRFDYTWVDRLLKEARQNRVRLVLLWFGSWKNGESTYAPEWVKTDITRFPRLQRRDGRPTLTLSPLGEATLEADRRAFAALMGHLRKVDEANTVIMVQVENEIGSHGVARDYSAAAEALFAQPPPAEVLQASKVTGGSWKEAFGQEADQAFAAWTYARYVEKIAAAGKAEKPLPLYTNAAVFDAKGTSMASQIASGGPNWNVLPIWKAVAPSLDLIGPDLYLPMEKVYQGLLDRYALPDNALFVPETSNSAWAARYFWSVLGRGAIGFSPFGMDSTNYSNYPLGARKLDASTIEAFAALYRLFAPIASDWASVASRHPTWGSSKTDSGQDATTLGRWRVTVAYGRNNFDIPFPGAKPPPWSTEPVGGGVVAQLGPDEFLVAGQYSRFKFEPADESANGQILSVEEGTFVDGQWRAKRRWNGDQTHHGFNFNEEPTLLRVRLSTY